MRPRYTIASLFALFCSGLIAGSIFPRLGFWVIVSVAVISGCVAEYLDWRKHGRRATK